MTSASSDDFGPQIPVVLREGGLPVDQKGFLASSAFKLHFPTPHSAVTKEQSTTQRSMDGRVASIPANPQFKLVDPQKD
jgi:hypothetical protein